MITTDLDSGKGMVFQFEQQVEEEGTRTKLMASAIRVIGGCNLIHSSTNDGLQDMTGSSFDDCSTGFRTSTSGASSSRTALRGGDIVRDQIRR